MNLAIIPARGGSQRIKRKNIKLFSGKPIIYYSIEIAKKSNLFQEVIVSTDDPEIKQISSEYGATVPFLRSKELSNNMTPTLPVIKDAILKCKKLGLKFKNVCCIYPTAPFIEENDVIETYKMLSDNKDKFCFPITEFSSSVYRSFVLKEKNKISLLFAENEKKRTQDLKKVFHDTAQFYWGTVDVWLNSEGIHSNGIGYIIPSWRVVDFDTEEDWKRAEIVKHVIKKKMY